MATKEPKRVAVGFLQLEERAIDHTPIYFLAITKTVKAGTIIRFDKGSNPQIEIVPKQD